MKLIMIAYSRSVDEEIMEILQANSVEGYTKWTRVLGKGKSSGPHLGDHVWPKLNNVLAVAVPDDKVTPVLSGVREMRERIASEGVKAFVLDIEEAT